MGIASPPAGQAHARFVDQSRLSDRIDVDGKNQVAVTLRLDSKTIRSLPNLQQAASPQQESPRSTDFQAA
jgi:hypothetical protein